MALEDGALSKWWRQASRSARAVALLIPAGVVLVLTSLLPSPGPDDAWLRDFLMTVGASLALFAPFYLLTRSLDRHLDRVAQEATQQVEQVRTEAAAHVEALRVEVDRRLEDVARGVSDRLAAETAADKTAFRALRTEAPRRQGLIAALTRALSLGLISHQRPPRVSVSDKMHLCVSVALVDVWSDLQPEFRLELADGHVLDRVEWLPGRPAEEVLVDVGRLLFKNTGEKFDAARLFIGLADLLDVALTDDERRPAVELFPPQWVLSEWGLARYDGPPYTVGLVRLRQAPRAHDEIAEKTWVDRDSWDLAWATALMLLPGDDDPLGAPRSGSD